ncbi:competence/damage-inducible protein A [Carnobacterium viridans]|uniref:Putative competence-damage inducible protein n=1 Tax=Carnobacterium viridans TaxID=174587 RepID=A0A1H1BB90_9LACT|nr:competence/damage-inducible protein A [Carnobacterium viridans]SDQ49140.1 competence/damage-inducible protein cinA [Carnobacterium viridans]
MNAEIIAVGTELLMGQVVNTNASFLSRELSLLGIDVYHQVVVGDNPKRLLEVIEVAEKRSDLVILSGGLGPTKDDITKQVLAEHLNKKLILDTSTMDKISNFFENSKRVMTENNRLQAMVVEGSTVLKNETGLAAGMLLNQDKQAFLLLPGPPSELEPMFIKEVRPLLMDGRPNENHLVSRVLRFFGIGESQVAAELDDLIEEQKNPTLATYAGKHEVTLRLTANGSTEEACHFLLDKVEAIIQQRIGGYFYGYGEDRRLVNVVTDLLNEQNLTLTAAESLTGGSFQHLITSVSGASDYFKGGIVTYSNDAKTTILGVTKKTIEEFGVVSAECAIEMAKKAQEMFDTDLAISFTGVAGPDKLENKEVGTVWIGIATKETAFAKEYHFGKGRENNREKSIMSGLDLIRRVLLNLPIEQKVL